MDVFVPVASYAKISSRTRLFLDEITVDNFNKSKLKMADLGISGYDRPAELVIVWVVMHFIERMLKLSAVILQPSVF